MRPGFLHDVKKKRNDIQALRMVKHVMTKKDFLTAFFVSGDRIQNFF